MILAEAFKDAGLMSEQDVQAIVAEKQKRIEDAIAERKLTMSPVSQQEITREMCADVMHTSAMLLDGNTSPENIIRCLVQSIMYHHKRPFSKQALKESLYNYRFMHTLYGKDAESAEYTKWCLFGRNL